MALDDSTRGWIRFFIQVFQYSIGILKAWERTGKI